MNANFILSYFTNIKFIDLRVRHSYGNFEILVNKKKSNLPIFISAMLSNQKIEQNMYLNCKYYLYIIAKFNSYKT